MYSFFFLCCVLNPINFPLCCNFAGLALIMWNCLYTAEKIIIQWTLLSEACYFTVQFLGDLTFSVHSLIVLVMSFCPKESDYFRLWRWVEKLSLFGRQFWMCLHCPLVSNTWNHSHAGNGWKKKEKPRSWTRKVYFLNLNLAVCKNKWKCLIFRIRWVFRSS